MSKDNTQDELRTKVSSITHRIRTRSLRGAEIYLSHVHEVDKGIEYLVKAEVCQALDRLKEKQVDMLRHQNTGYYDTKDPRIKCIEVSAIEAERKRYE